MNYGIWTIFSFNDSMFLNEAMLPYSHCKTQKHKDHMSTLSWNPQFHLLSKVNERSKFVWLEVYINLPDNFLSDVKDSNIFLTNTN